MFPLMVAAFEVGAVRHAVRTGTTPGARSACNCGLIWDLKLPGGRAGNRAQEAPFNRWRVLLDLPMITCAQEQFCPLVTPLRYDILKPLRNGNPAASRL